MYTDQKFIEDILPEEYWEALRASELYKISLHLTYNFIAVVIPAFGEELYIKKTIENFTKNQKNINPREYVIIIVYKSHSIEDRTASIIEKYKSDYPSFNIISINEESVPGEACIGHARSIGFGVACLIAEWKSIPLQRSYFVSADSDTVDIDAEYLYKITRSFQNKKISIVSCKNKLTDLAMSHEYINILKVIEDSFFFKEFKIIGALNGRCYALRGDVYVRSGGVDYKLQFDDIAFGVKLHKILKKENYKWMRDSYVITSERRLAESINKSSLMSEYGTHKPIGNQLHRVFKEDEKVIYNFYSNHINEGLNVLVYYFAKRFPYKENEKDLLIGQYSHMINYMNKHFKQYEVSDLDTERALELYKLFSSENAPKEWWKEKINFTLKKINRYETV